MKRIAVIVFLSVFAFALQAQNIIFENLEKRISQKDSLKIIRVLNYEMDFYKQFGNIDSAHLKLRVFPNKTAYQAYLLTLKAPKSVRKHSGGLFYHKTNELLVFKSDNRNYLEVVYHETNHYLFYLVMKKPPTWLNKGLAEYFEHINIGKNIKHYISSYRIGFVKSQIELKELNLKEFVSAKYKEFWDETITNENYSYTLAHAIVYFLLEKDQTQFRQMLLKIKDGTDSFAAIDETYPNGFARFEKDFTAYYLKK